jgi:hypothetical protein
VNGVPEFREGTPLFGAQGRPDLSHIANILRGPSFGEPGFSLEYTVNDFGPGANRWHSIVRERLSSAGPGQSRAYAPAWREWICRARSAGMAYGCAVEGSGDPLS